MRTIRIIVAAVAVLGVIGTGCGPKPTKQEMEAPPSKGPGTPGSAGGAPASAGRQMGSGPSVPR